LELIQKFVLPNTSLTKVEDWLCTKVGVMSCRSIIISGDVVSNVIIREHPEVTHFLVGQSRKIFIVHTELLKKRLMLFEEIFGTPPLSDDTLLYPDLDELSFALFVRWLYGATLAGPTGFHTIPAGVHLRAHSWTLCHALFLGGHSGVPNASKGKHE
jgi:hypothetical protein